MPRSPLAAAPAAALAAALGAGWPALAAAQGPPAAPPSSPPLAVEVVDAVTGAPVRGADVRAGGLEVRTGTGGEAVLALDAPAGSVRVTVEAYGYAAADTALAPPGPHRVALAPRPFDLLPLTVRAEPGPRGAAVERALFGREPRPGVVGLSGEELRDLPFLVERDVLRSLQALPGVARTSDVSARLHVRGGAPDQNLFLLDGAPVLGPYHLFGVFGVLDAGTVRRVEFFRGSIPARYGGALSSVIEVEQRTDSEGERPDGEVGVGLLAARGQARGTLAGGRVAWLAAGRRSVTGAALAGLGLTDGAGAGPFDFFDAQLKVEASPDARTRIRASAYASDDDFTMFFEGAQADLASSWSNRVVSLRGDRELGGPWSLTAAARHTGYDARLRAGGDAGSPVTTNAVELSAARIEARRRGEATGVRAGAELQRTAARLDGGDEPGGYVDGVASERMLLGSAWVEVERWLGRVRLAPGVRVSVEGRDGELRVQPRLAARVRVADGVFVTAGAARTHQWLSTLRDDRYPLPGAPFWFLRAPGDPATGADEASLAAEAWLPGGWSATVGAWIRRFDAVPAWRPEGDRSPRRVGFEEGRTRGAEVMVRRHGGRVRGWAAYTWGRTTMDGPDGPYFAAWDRRHGVELAAFWEAGTRWTLSARASYGAGTPFWPQAGDALANWLDPRTGQISYRERFPVWSDRQRRYPDYFRADLGARHRFHVGPAELEVHGSVVNVTARENVFFYELAPGDAEPGAGQGPLELVPSSQLPFTVLPSLGIDVRF